MAHKEIDPDDQTIRNFNRTSKGRGYSKVDNVESAGAGRELRFIRQERSLSISALAERCGMSMMTISQIERGRNKTNIDMLSQIFSAMGIPIWEVLLKIELEKGKERKPYSHYKPLFDQVCTTTI